MSRTRYFAVVLLFSLFASETLGALGMQKVEYLADSITNKEGEHIRLLGGSQWVLSSSTLALVTTNIIIVFEEIELKDKSKAKFAVAYIDGDEIVAEHVGANTSLLQGTSRKL